MFVLLKHNCLMKFVHIVINIIHYHSLFCLLRNRIFISSRGKDVQCIARYWATQRTFSFSITNLPSVREKSGEKNWHSLVYAEVRSDVVLRLVFFVFCKFVFVVVHSVWRDFSTRDNDKSREIRGTLHERCHSSTLFCCHIIRLNVVSKSLLSVCNVPVR